MRDMQWRDAVRREMRRRGLDRSRSLHVRTFFEARRRKESRSQAASLLVAMLGGAAIGVGLMYLLDPDRGAQRRAWTRDRLVRWRHRIADTAEATSRDVAHRAHGVVARTRTWFRDESVPDDTLVERVRAEMGRKVSHPRAITVEAHDGLVVLGGPVFAGEVERLLHAVERVRGVRDVENRLEVHATATNVPSLQGAEPLGRSAGFWQRSWPPATRLVVGTSGAALVLAGLPRRSSGGYWAGIAGAALLLRALTNAPRWVTPIRDGHRVRSRRDGEGGSPPVRSDEPRSSSPAEVAGTPAETVGTRAETPGTRAETTGTRDEPGPSPSGQRRSDAVSPFG